MTENNSSTSFTPEEAIEWLRHHVLVMQGYAFALAQKAGLTVGDAAHLFVEPLLATPSSWPTPTSQVLEQQAIQSATVLALTYGQEQVHREQHDNSWLLKATLTQVHRENLERYGASLEFHTQWLAEQLRLVCEPKNIHSTVRQTSDGLSISLRL
jgi:hypothetical protein